MATETEDLAASTEQDQIDKLHKSILKIDDIADTLSELVPIVKQNAETIEQLKKTKKQDEEEKKPKEDEDEEEEMPKEEEKEKKKVKSEDTETIEGLKKAMAKLQEELDTLKAKKDEAGVGGPVKAEDPKVTKSEGKIVDPTAPPAISNTLNKNVTSPQMFDFMSEAINTMNDTDGDLYSVVNANEDEDTIKFFEKRLQMAKDMKIAKELTKKLPHVKTDAPSVPKILPEGKVVEKKIPPAPPQTADMLSAIGGLGA